MYYLTEKCTIPYQDCDLQLMNKLVNNTFSELMNKLVNNTFSELMNKLVNNTFSDNWLEEVWNRLTERIAQGNLPNYDQGKQLVDNYVKYGAINWDEWSCKYWGTKWNAYYQYINDNVIYF